MCETFFSKFREMDPRRRGVLKPSELPRGMSKACQLMETHMNPDRPFYIASTSRTPCYPEYSAERGILEDYVEDVGWYRKFIETGLRIKPPEIFNMVLTLEYDIQIISLDETTTKT